MPDYDFYCDDCGYEFEKTLKVDESREDLKCPVCGSKSIERLIKKSAAQAFLRRFRSGGCGNTGGG